jgi:hypothetical protein
MNKGKKNSKEFQRIPIKTYENWTYQVERQEGKGGIESWMGEHQSGKEGFGWIESLC